MAHENVLRLTLWNNDNFTKRVKPKEEHQYPSLNHEQLSLHQGYLNLESLTLGSAEQLFMIAYNMGRESVQSTTSSGKGGPSMNWQEKYLDKLDRDISDMKNALQATEDRIARMIESAMTEMRDRDNQRHQEMIEIRTSLDSMHKQINEQTKYLNERLNEQIKWVIGTAIATILGIAALVATALFDK